MRAVKAQRQTGASQISYVKILTDNPKHYHTSRNKDQLGNKWRSLEEKYKGHWDTDDCLDRIEIDLIRGNIKKRKRSSSSSKIPWSVDETLHLARAVKAQRQTGALQISYVKILTDNPKQTLSHLSK